MVLGVLEYVCKLQYQTAGLIRYHRECRWWVGSEVEEQLADGRQGRQEPSKQDRMSTGKC